MEAPLFYRVSDVCRMLGIGKTRFYGEVKADRIATVRNGRRTLVHRDELTRYVEVIKVT